MDAIGVMAMPADFRYREVFLKGKPQHDRLDPFQVRHPRMDTGHRAKIFAPFDALKGFDEALAAQKTLQEERFEPDHARKTAETNARCSEIWGEADVYEVLY